MLPTAPPSARCPHCGANWLTPRVLYSEEPRTVALVCVACSRDYELIAGALVAITRSPMEASA